MFTLKPTSGIAVSLSALLLASCGQNTPEPDPTPSETAETSGPTLSIAYEKFTLDNGLDVVFHVDKSDPVVAIDLAAHVGSAREVEGRTGFAHLFEHLLFLDSENLGYGGLDEMNTRIGGEGTNGFTTHDMTQYFQAVPADALEKVVWAEADKLGYFINTVTQPVIDNEKQVVKNEKRQRVDNRPYGHNFYIINKALYPADHPYNWQVIGSLDDLQAATLQDVKDFYGRWYVPNNVTVTIAGDFDPALARTYVEKYFGEIPRGEEVAPLTPRAGTIETDINLYHEDNFATVPQLTYVWPAVEQFHPDSYALDILTTYLTEGKRAPLNEVLIDEEELTSAVSMFSYTKEIAGELYLFVSGNSGEDLDLLPPAIQTAFKRFEENGISQADLDRIKAGLEVDFYNDLQSALGKAIQLGEYNLFTDDPGFVSTDLERLLSVTTDDVMRVYQTYIKDRPLISTSFVPRGKLDLTIEGSVKAEVVEEAIEARSDEAPVEFDPTVRNFEMTPSSFDRTIEPPFGEGYDLPSPAIWRAEMDNGITVSGIESSEVPLVTFSLKIDAGRDRGDPSKPAVASLTADLLNKGTANKTTAELEDAIQSLGSSISISAGQYGTFVTGTSLARNFNQTIALVEEMILAPRWDEAEFDILMRSTRNTLDQQEGDPAYLVARSAAELRYPEGHIFSFLSYGTKELLEDVTLDDLKAFYDTNYTPENTTLEIVGDVASKEVLVAFGGLSENWTKEGPGEITLALPNPVESSTVYFYDVPGAKQSVVRIERPSLAATDPDYPLADGMNLLLGGIYTSDLMTELRVNKGYTYGIGSGFSGEKDRGLFSIRSSVRSNVTLESLELIRDIVANYGPEFTEEKLTVLKGALLRGQALQTETMGDKLSILQEIRAYGYPDDYRAKNADRIDAMTLEDIKRLADEYFRPDAMNWILSGDAETQAGRLEELGFGAPVMLE